VESVDDTHQIDIDDASPVFQGGIDQVSTVPDSRIVEQQIDRAGGEDDVGESFHCGSVRDIDGVRHRIAAGLADSRDDGRDALGIPVGKMHGRATLGEQGGDRAADARAGAGDDCGSTGQIIGFDAVSGAAAPDDGRRPGGCDGDGSLRDNSFVQRSLRFVGIDVLWNHAWRRAPERGQLRCSERCNTADVRFLSGSADAPERFPPFGCRL